MGDLSWSVDPILTLALSLKEREFLVSPIALPISPLEPACFAY